jgi:hypothetical protein
MRHDRNFPVVRGVATKVARRGQEHTYMAALEFAARFDPARSRSLFNDNKR